MSASSGRITQDVAAAERPTADPTSLERMREAPTHPGEVFLKQFLEAAALGIVTPQPRACWGERRAHDRIRPRKAAANV